MLEICKHQLAHLFDKTGRFVFLACVLIMVATHGFCFANLMYTHDSLSFYNTGGLDKIALGRWLYPVVARTRAIASPWVIGSLCITYVSLAVVLVVKVLQLRNEARRD